MVERRKDRHNQRVKGVLQEEFRNIILYIA